MNSSRVLLSILWHVASPDIGNAMQATLYFIPNGLKIAEGRRYPDELAANEAVAVARGDLKEMESLQRKLQQSLELIGVVVETELETDD